MEFNSKQELRYNLVLKCMSDLVSMSDDSAEEDVIQDFVDTMKSVELFRYAITETRVPKSYGLLANLLPNYDDKRFKRFARLSRPQFCKLHDLIKDDAVFQTSSNQYPVSIQLLTALARFGSFGNAASVTSIARTIGIGDGGSCIRFTKRVIHAILNLEKSYIFWPNFDERKNIASQMAEENFPLCIGFLDGTHIRLANAPAEDHVSYFNRKGFYSLNLQLITDPSKRVRAYHVGQPGKVHDSRVFQLMDISKNPALYFSNDQYILADQAYRLTTTVITPYRKCQIHSRDEEKFNYILSTKRISIEHANGLLKGRFQSLNGLRMTVNREAGHQYACEWVVACLILHNMLINDDPWDEGDSVYSPTLDHHEDANSGTDDDIGKSKRDALKNFVLHR